MNAIGNAVRSDIFRMVGLLLSVNASFSERVARLEDRGVAEDQEEKLWQGRVEDKLEMLERQATLAMSLNMARGV
jgi:hypothetical protein